MKRLRLKIWVEDEDGKIKTSQAFAGGLPQNGGQPNILEFDWTDNSREIDLKVMINSLATLLKAKYGDDYIPKLPLVRAQLRELLDQ